MSKEELQKNILTTIAYYDAMDYPMTSFEVWKYLTRINGQDEDVDEKISLFDVLSELESDKLKNIIEEYRGFYFLRGQKDLVEQRNMRNKISNSKYKTIVKIVRWLRFVPYVRMIAVSGRLAMKNAETKSDLDLLIVLKHRRIFIGRTLVTLVVHLLGKRRHGTKITNRACLNYFITTKSLEINLKDVFSSSEYYFLVPVFGFRVFKKFQKQNQWIKKYKPNYQIEEIPHREVVGETRLIRWIRKIGEVIFDLDILEKFLKNWQLRRIQADPRTHLPGNVVIANDEMLIFLPEPHGPKIFDKFKDRLENLQR